MPAWKTSNYIRTFATVAIPNLGAIKGMVEVDDESHFVQLYFEEAHNLFPVDDKDLTGVYARLAKEGAKFHLGMVYSTQSPSTINRELLAQTENVFVDHLSSQHEAQALGRCRSRSPDTSRTSSGPRPPGTCGCSPSPTGSSSRSRPASSRRRADRCRTTARGRPSSGT
jgi:hypothetical protein